MTKLSDRLEALFHPLLNPMGLSIVRILLMGKSKMTLQVMIERMDTEPLSMEECVKASKAISEALDVEDPIEGTYALEVTSPGLDRPLLKPADFQRYVGSGVQVTLLAPGYGGARKHEGLLTRADDQAFDLSIKGQPLEKGSIPEKVCVTVAYTELGQAKLHPEFKF